MSQPSGYRERNSTADRALTLLQMFSDERPELSAAEVAGHLAVARSTAYRYLQSLVRSGFLVETGRGAFRLGFRILELARIARRGYGLEDLCVPAMHQLADDLGQTVLLTKRMGTAAVCLEREEARDQYVRLSYERGTVLSLNAGASALVLLAWLPESEVRSLLSSVDLHAFTPRTLVAPDDIVQRLTDIRATGFAVSEGELDPNAFAVAAPVFDHAGAVSAAISVVALRSLVDQPMIDRITTEVITVAADLSRHLAVLAV